MLGLHFKRPGSFPFGQTLGLFFLAPLVTPGQAGFSPCGFHGFFPPALTPSFFLPRLGVLDLGKSPPRTGPIYKGSSAFRPFPHSDNESLSRRILIILFFPLLPALLFDRYYSSPRSLSLFVSLKLASHNFSDPFCFFFFTLIPDNGSLFSWTVFFSVCVPTLTFALSPSCRTPPLAGKEVG